MTDFAGMAVRVSLCNNDKGISPRVFKIDTANADARSTKKRSRRLDGDPGSSTQKPRLTDLVQPSQPRARTLLRFGLIAIAAALACFGFLIAPRWVVALLSTPERRPIVRTCVLWCLRLAAGVHLAAWVILPLALIVFTWRVIRRRRAGKTAPRAARLALLAGSLLLTLCLTEGVAVWALESSRGRPNLPLRFSAQSEAGLRTIAVIGESSAMGLPYDPWVSVADIMAWKLSTPEKPVRVEMHAHGGICLEQAILALEELKHKPDALLIYAGHNEFQARFGWSRNVRHYRDEQPAAVRSGLEKFWYGASPAARLISQNIDRQMLDEPPPRDARRELVDHPAFRVGEYEYLLADFERRLDDVVIYAKKIGAIPILVAPAGNEADYPPFRSYLSPECDAAERAGFRTRFEQARLLEETDPAAARTSYEGLALEYPQFAETRFRLGQLARARGDLAEARRHFERARDLDGMPMRCPSDFLAAIKRVALRHDAVFVDARDVLQRIDPLRTVNIDALLDSRFFHDPQHPNLRGYTAIAYEVLRHLNARPNGAWSSEHSTTPLSLEEAHAECAAHFQMDDMRWAEICRKTAILCTRIAAISRLPQIYLAQADQLIDAMEAIRAGASPASVGIPGIGVGSLPTAAR